MASSLDQRASRVRLIVFDVDGVLTRGGIIYGPEGEWKIFDVQDGHGFAMARKAGLKTALLTARSSPVVERRARELGVDQLLQGVAGKGNGVGRIMEAQGLGPQETCYVGDDLVDLPAMRRVGFAVAVANAVPEVKEAACWTTERRGGEGAAREVIERILRARGLWKGILREYVEETP